MVTLSASQMCEVNAGMSQTTGWGIACVSSVVGWVGSIAAATVLTGGVGTAALLAWAGGHILADISAGTSCAAWIAASQR